MFKDEIEKKNSKTKVQKKRTQVNMSLPIKLAFRVKKLG